MVDITYKGAFHKITNCGIEGGNIFSGDSLKTFFLELLKEKSKNFDIRLLAYNVTDNSYCLVLQNSSGLLTDFMRELEGQYAINYTKKEGKKGYIFPDRFESVMIQEGPYLRKTIIHVLLIPVRERITDKPYNYRWSSIKEYYSNKKETMVDKIFTEKIFQSQPTFNKLIGKLKNKKLNVKRTRFGAVIGGENFGKEAIKKYYELDNEGGEAKMVLYQDQLAEINHILDTVDIVINLFDKKIKDEGVRIKKHAKPDKELNSESLVALKNKASIRHKGITDTHLFHHLKDSSFGQFCKKAKDKFMNT